MNSCPPGLNDYPSFPRLTKATSLDSVRLLIKEGQVDLQKKNKNGSSALHIAAYYGRMV